MKLWAVSRVKDELDILPYTFEHLLSEGVDGLLICDNMSTDGTLEWLTAKHRWWHRNTLTCHYWMDTFTDYDLAYYQSAKMTALVDEAFQRGADWVIPFDADECWYCPDGRTLKDYFSDLSGVDVITATVHDYYPTSDDRRHPNPYLRIRHRDPEPALLPKVAVSRRGVIIDRGNHSASGFPDMIEATSTLTVGHFPWRFYDQFERKVDNHARAYAAANLPDYIGATWTDLGQILDRDGPDGLRAAFDKWYVDPEMDLEERPVPWVGMTGAEHAEHYYQ
jgi:hypothetical protein